MPRASVPESKAAVPLLRGALVFAAVALVVVAGWLGYEAVARPDVGASLYGKGRSYTPVYWPALLAFSLCGLGAIVLVLRGALRRVEAGADPFRSRYSRRHGGGPARP